MFIVSPIVLEFSIWKIKHLWTWLEYNSGWHYDQKIYNNLKPIGILTKFTQKYHLSFIFFVHFVDPSNFYVNIFF